MSTRCERLRRIGYEEWVCGISGVRMEPDDCAGGDGDCVPRLALRYLNGTLDGSYNQAVMEAIMATAAQILEKNAATDGLSLRAMNEKQLEQLIEQARQRRRLLGRTKRRLPGMRKRLQQLLDRRQSLEESITAQEAAIRAVEEGRALPPGPPRAPARPGKAGKGRIERTPEERAALNKRRVQLMNAARLRKRAEREKAGQTTGERR